MAYAREWHAVSCEASRRSTSAGQATLSVHQGQQSCLTAHHLQTGPNTRSEAQAIHSERCLAHTCAGTGTTRQHEQWTNLGMKSTAADTRHTRAVHRICICRLLLARSRQVVLKFAQVRSPSSYLFILFSVSISQFLTHPLSVARTPSLCLYFCFYFCL